MWKRWQGVIILALLACAPYVGTLNADFTAWDDTTNVVHNPLFGPNGGLERIWTTAYDGMYIPVSYTFWWVISDFRISGPTSQPQPSIVSPVAFHAVNVLLHIGCVLIVQRLLKKLFGNEWAAFAGAAIFALHPLQVETVAWVSGMRDLLAAGFALVAIWQIIEEDEAKIPRAIAIATTAFALALLSKPSAVVTPFVAAAVLMITPKRFTRRHMIVLGFWVLMAIPVALTARQLQPGGVVFGKQIDWLHRPLIAMDSIGFYLKKLFWPINLGIDYGRTPQRIVEHPGWLWAIPLIAIALIQFCRNRRTWNAIALIFVAGLLPVLGLVPFNFQFYSTVADHYVYLPMLGVAIAAGSLARCWRVAILLIAGMLGIISMNQVGFWKNTQTLMTRAITVNPNSFVAHHNLAETLVAQNDIVAAREEFLSALRIRPNYGPSQTELGMLLLKTGRFDEGLDLLIQAIHTAQAEDPSADLRAVRQNIGAMLRRRGRNDEADRLLREGDSAR